MPDVLLVEDEFLIACLVEQAFTDAGLRVAVAHDGQGACEALEREARSFAAVVTDINLGPGANGFDVAQCARELNPAVKVVYISGHAAHLDKAAVEEALVVPKPFDVDRLAARVTELVRG